jgi:Flp pilus assembly protein TadD
MQKTLICSLSLILILVTTAAAQDIGPPKLTPVPSTEKEKSIIKEGIALHDRGDYDGAIAKYEEVLKDNPDNVLALYEQSYSLFLKKDYRKSLEKAYKGAQYKSDNLIMFYVTIGNNLDLLGDPQKAVKVYKKGIELEPNASLIYYNLAVTYRNLNNAEDAKKNLKRAVQLNPNHPSSHLVLGVLFSQTGYNTPAFLALSRFLVLEPRSARTVNAFQMYQDLLRGGASPGKNPNEINISLNLNAKKDEGDFGSIDLVMGLTGATSLSDKNEGKSQSKVLVDQLESYFAILSEMDPKGDKSKFTWKYYIPYFIEMKKRKYVEPFAYYISQRSNLEGVEQWLAANKDRVTEFLNWSKSYQWAKD